MHFQLTLHLNFMAYKLKNENEVLSVKGFSQSFKGDVDEQVYKLLIKAHPQLADKFEGSKEDESSESSSPVKSDE